MRTTDTIPWHPASWTSRPAQQQPRYTDIPKLESNVAALAKLPPLVVSWEIEQLRERLADAQRGAQVPAHGRRLRRDLRRVRVGQDRQEAQDPAADEPGAVARPEEAHHSRRPHGRPVRQAAFGGHRNPQRRDAAGIPRRSRQSSRVHAGSARAGSGAAAARLRTRRAHAEFCARAVRRRFRRPASPAVLGSGLHASFAGQGGSTRRSSIRSPTRWTSSSA